MILGADDVVEPPLSFEIVGPVDGIRWLLVKQDGRVVYQRTLTDDEQHVVENNLEKYSWMEQILDVFNQARDSEPNS